LLKIGLEAFAVTSAFLPGVSGFVHGVWAASRLSAEMAATGNGSKEAALAALIRVVNVTSI